MFRRKRHLSPDDSNMPGSSTSVGNSIEPWDNAAWRTSNTAEMRSVNGCEFRAANRQASQSDKDYSPWLARRYTNMSVTDVQLHNGMRWKVLSGKRINYAGAGFLNVVVPQIPGQTRDNVAGFHKRGPSPYRIQDVWDNGPGSQPAHPGGPGKIASPTFINPMTG
jgi:hypothetical protein